VEEEEEEEEEEKEEKGEGNKDFFFQRLKPLASFPNEESMDTFEMIRQITMTSTRLKLTCKTRTTRHRKGLR